MAAHVWEKEDGNPYYSAFNTEQEPASLSSKKYGWRYVYILWVRSFLYGRVENMWDRPYY